MLKRTTKITSLLVVATSMISMIPAMASDIRKVSAEEGTVYGAKSNADGSFYLDAELNGGDEAIFAYKDGKYTKVDGADAGDTIGDVLQYDGNSYLEMDNGDYYVNLKTGEKTDEDIRGNIDDDADIAIKKAIKADNDGRFNENTYTGNVIKADNSIQNAPGNTHTTMYGPTGVWRQYYYTLKKPFSDGTTTIKDKSLIYSDKDGKYVDADYNLGKIGVYNTTGASVTVENTKDTYTLAVGGVDYTIRAQIEGLVTWDDTMDSITRTSALSIWGTTDGTNYTNLTSQVKFGSSNNHHSQVTSNSYTNSAGTTFAYDSVRVIQTISKAQASSSVDGIKYSKNVKTYFITDDKGTSQSLYGLNPGYALLTDQTDGTLVSVDFTDVLNGSKEVKAQTVTLKSEQGYNYTDLDSDKSDTIDMSDVKDKGIGCGDVYALADGYIQRFNGKEGKFEKLEKVDGGMNKLSASLPIFAVTWNEDDKVYSIITPGAQKDDKGAATTDTVAGKSGWTKAADGTWTFVNADGTAARGWKQDGATWYYLDPTTGVMATGWKNVGDTWYYLNASGAMQTGWINDNGTWYYCNASGAMLANTTVDGYTLGANGAWTK